MSTINITKIGTLFVLAASIGSCSYGTYTSAQHDWRIHNDFRSEIFKDPSPRLITVETDGVTRKGFLNRGAAMSRNETALILAQSKEAACWYTTLRVVEGQENLPFMQKIFGGAEGEDMFANQAFRGYECYPTTGHNTIGDTPAL